MITLQTGCLRLIHRLPVMVLASVFLFYREDGKALGTSNDSVDEVRRLVPELFAYVDSRGHAVHLGSEAWLCQWLRRALNGGLTDFPIRFIDSSSTAAYRKFGAASRGPQDGRSRGGEIWLASRPAPQGSDAHTINQVFVNQWLSVFMELSNLMSNAVACDLARRVYDDSIAEQDFARASIIREKEAEIRSIILFDAIIGPLRMAIPHGQDDRILWEASYFADQATRMTGFALINDSNPEYIDHFQYYRTEYRRMRADAARTGYPSNEAIERNAVKNAIKMREKVRSR